MTMSIDIETLKLLINVATFSMTKKIEEIENKFQTKVDTLEEENRQLYKVVEKLSETNARNEMYKEDKNSLINKLYRSVKVNKTNIKKLFENDKNINDNIDEINDNINEINDNIDEINNDTIYELFTKCKNNHDNIAKLFENDKIHEKNIYVLFKNCKLYNKQIEILFDNDNTK